MFMKDKKSPGINQREFGNKGISKTFLSISFDHLGIQRKRDLIPPSFSDYLLMCNGFLV